MDKKITYSKVEKAEYRFSAQEVLTALLQKEKLPLYDNDREASIEFEEDDYCNTVTIVTLKFAEAICPKKEPE